MARTNNYLMQAQQAKRHFLTYDQGKLIAKFNLTADEAFLYVKLLCKQYRLDRKTGDLFRREGVHWQDGNSFEEVMTLLDLLCDSRDDRHLSGRWRSMQSFGLEFHQNLLENRRDGLADYFDTQPEKLRQACLALNAEPIPGGDMGYAVELFDGLKIGILFWAGDEEFTPRFRYLWDENADQYIRYETMFYAVDVLRQRLGCG